MVRKYIFRINLSLRLRNKNLSKFIKELEAFFSKNPDFCETWVFVVFFDFWHQKIVFSEFNIYIRIQLFELHLTMYKNKKNKNCSNFELVPPYVDFPHGSYLWIALLDHCLSLRDSFVHDEHILVDNDQFNSTASL